MCWGEEGEVWCAGMKMEGVMCWSEEGGVWCAGVKREECGVLG